MAGCLTCAECGEKFNKLFEDARVPPLDFGDCLCAECCVAHCDEAIEELKEEIHRIHYDIRAVADKESG